MMSGSSVIENSIELPSHTIVRKIIEEARVDSFPELLSYLSVKELCEVLEVNFGGLNLLVKYPGQLRIGQMIKLAEYLGVDVGRI